MTYTTQEVLAQPIRFLEMAAAEGSYCIVFEATADAVKFYRRLRALCWPNARGAKFGCVLDRTKNVVTAATDPEAMPKAELRR